MAYILISKQFSIHSVNIQVTLCPFSPLQRLLQLMDEEMRANLDKFKNMLNIWFKKKRDFHETTRFPTSN